MTEPVALTRIQDPVRLGVPISPELRRAYRCRALLLWPGLDRIRLSRTRGDPFRIACLVARRSGQPFDVIVSMVVGDRVASGDSGAPGPMKPG